MEKYLERYNLLRLNQEEIENMDKPITSTVTDFSNLKTPKQKVQDQMVSEINSTKHLENS